MSHPSRRRSLRTRWAIWRARYSTVGLLARFDERKAVSLVAAVKGGLAILALGVFAWLTDLPLTFPALGPTAFILFATPTSESAAPRSVILGHFAGMGSGFAVWHLMSTLAGGPVSPQTGGWPLILSASLALAVTCGLLVRLSCPHPPACASSLVIASLNRAGILFFWPHTLGPEVRTPPKCRNKHGVANGSHHP